jgi:hypothetical protein
MLSFRLDKRTIPLPNPRSKILVFEPLADLIPVCELALLRKIAWIS